MLKGKAWRQKRTVKTENLQDCGEISVDRDDFSIQFSEILHLIHEAGS